MPDTAIRQTEARLAGELNKNLEESLTLSRTRYIALTGLLIVAACGIAVTGFWTVALIAFVLGMISLSQFFDANGNLQEVRRRSTRTLVRDFSVLRPADGETSPKSTSP